MRGRKRSDLSALEGQSIAAFREAMKSESTSDVYQRRLALFLRWAKLTADERARRGRGPRPGLLSRRTITLSGQTFQNM